MRLFCLCSNKSAFTALLHLGVSGEASRHAQKITRAVIPQFNNPAVARRSQASPDIHARPWLQSMDVFVVALRGD